MISCVIRYKDTNLKAIHNCPACWPCFPPAVSSDTKIQIWKQFTTISYVWGAGLELCHPIQRYKFESNSQPEHTDFSSKVCCVIRYKDTNLKAIHNGLKKVMSCHVAVSSDTKIQIWKQFTTKVKNEGSPVRLCHPIQRYKFESNSQPV